MSDRELVEWMHRDLERSQIIDAAPESSAGSLPEPRSLPTLRFVDRRTRAIVQYDYDLQILEAELNHGRDEFIEKLRLIRIDDKYRIGEELWDNIKRAYRRGVRGVDLELMFRKFCEVMQLDMREVEW